MEGGIIPKVERVIPMRSAAEKREAGGRRVSTAGAAFEDVGICLRSASDGRGAYNVLVVRSAH